MGWTLRDEGPELDYPSKSYWENNEAHTKILSQFMLVTFNKK